MTRARRESRRRNGGPTSARGSGARSARTTAKTATPGTILPMTSRAHGPTGGASTGWGESVFVELAFFDRGMNLSQKEGGGISRDIGMAAGKTRGKSGND